MSDPQAALEYAHGMRDAALQDLEAVLRIASISTLPEHKGDMLEAAQWMADRMGELGFESVQTMDTGGPPVVYAERLDAGDDVPTVLVYGHYDVQPVDPLDLWKSAPFEPEIRGDDLFARGASDMKGQIVAHFRAVEALDKTSGIPVNVKYFVEGEEEIGSPHLESFIRNNRNLLAADFCLNVDAGVLSPETPALTYGLRGLAYFEINLQGPEGDLHSGMFGGAVLNPANVLANLISKMHDERGRVTLPGFYEDVRPLSDEERSALADLPQTDDWWKQQTGVQVLGGEEGYTATERVGARPTLDVNGLLSGFIGEGSKTVLPATAMAKISARLVPDQDPEKVHQGLLTFMEQNAPSSVSWDVKTLANAGASIIERDSREVRAAVSALETVWGAPVKFRREGGTVPVVGMIKELLEVDTLMLGFGLPDDNLHAPNEKLHLPNYYRGIDTFIHFMSSLAA